ncbi:hypothetical protein HAX54_045458, partial [Datura stramonium]|nr:hypothetical protein [Datura stramonium]
GIWHTELCVAKGVRRTAHFSLKSFNEKTSSISQIPPNFFTQIIKHFIFLEISPTVALKASKGKDVASSSHRNKRYRMGKEAPNEDASMPPQPPRRYGLHWATEQE